MTRSTSQWTSLQTIKIVLQKKWQKGIFLSESIESTGLFPMRIPLCGPTAAELSILFDLARVWVQQFKCTAAIQPFRIEWVQINHRILGQNNLPVALHFDSLLQIIRFLGKTKEYELITQLSQELLVSFPPLKSWLRKYPLTALELAPVWKRMICVTLWMVSNPRPGVYIRQLSLADVDTKFIESYKKQLGEWFDILLCPSDIDLDSSGVKGFEQRYGFLAKPSLVRLRFLDDSYCCNGFSDLTVRADEFCKTVLDIDTVFVTENDINGLAFPAVKRGIVLFGRGYCFDSIADAQWLNGKKIFYWGDIDTHGFTILNQFRKIFPHTESILMDLQTLTAHKKSWVTESSPNNAVLENLTQAELSLYNDLRSNRFGNSLRLEQEFIQFDLLKHKLNEISQKSFEPSLPSEL
jgi:hypothetical protein